MLKTKKQASQLFRGVDGLIGFLESGVPIGLMSLTLRTLADNYKVQAIDLYLDAIQEAYEGYKKQLTGASKDNLPDISKQAFADAIKHQDITIDNLETLNEKLRALLKDYGLDVYQQDPILSNTYEIFNTKLSNEPDLLNPMLSELVQQLRSSVGEQGSEIEKLKTHIQSEADARNKLQEEVSRLEDKLLTLRGCSFLWARC